ncbi:MAG: hypothetical protein AB7E80_15945 [Hyphomicrobiaceae bacterium]
MSRSACGGTLALVALTIAGCGEAEKPKVANHSVEGVVEKIEVHTRHSKLFGELSRFYEIKMKVPNSRDWYASLSSGYANETDMQSIIGETITLGCATEDPKITTCHHVVSIHHNGRNIVRR